MNKILIAKVISVFGIRGEVKLLVHSDDPGKIADYDLFDDSSNPVKVEITGKGFKEVKSSSGSDYVVRARINDINDRNLAEDLRGLEIFVDRSQLKGLKDGQFYRADLVGLEVLVDGQKFGQVKNVIDYGYGPNIEIEFLKSDPNNNFEKIEIFPFAGDYFGEVDLEKGTIVFNPPEIIK